MSEQFFIDKKESLWLKKALATHKTASENNKLVFVSTTRTYGKTVCASDGYRLHVVEISEEIPDGWYEVDSKVGSLTSTNYIREFGYSWEQLVPSCEKLYMDGEVPEETIAINGYTLKNVEKEFGTLVDVDFLDDALRLKLPYRLQTQGRNTTYPILITLGKTKRVHFAVIMPFFPPQRP